MRVGGARNRVSMRDSDPQPQRPTLLAKQALSQLSYGPWADQSRARSPIGERRKALFGLLRRPTDDATVIAWPLTAGRPNPPPRDEPPRRRAWCAPTGSERDDQTPLAIDAISAPVPPSPRDLPPAQRVARAPRVEDLGRRVHETPLERREQPRQQRLDLLAQRPRAGGGCRAAPPAAPPPAPPH